MARLKHKPGHPMADARGWVNEDDYYLYQYNPDAHLHYMEGNQVKRVGYIKDEMEPTRHMSNGKMYTSKKKFRDETRARGCIEVGNETKTLLTPRKQIELDRGQRRDDLRRAVYELKNGRRP